MIDRELARELAQQAVDHRQTVHRTSVTETKEGWFFPYEPGAAQIGSHGVVVHKKTGRTFVLGSAFSIERDLKAYDEGFQFKRYDLVVLEIHDRPKTLAVLYQVGPSVVTPEYRDGVVWRVPRRLSKYEIDQHLAKLPAVVPDVQLYFAIEALQEARAHGYFRFEALEYRGARTS
jgi:hypothetical protein